MKKLTLLVLSISGLTHSSFGKNFTVDHPEMKAKWSNWKNDHSKSYAEHEEPNKMGKFVDNYNSIAALNAKHEGTTTFELNHFADLTEEEFTAKYLGNLPNERPGNNIAQEEDKRFLASLPASVDWRTKGAVGPIKNQGHCGGCWSFAATGALEALHHIKTGVLLSFSEQQLLNCNKYSDGCVRGHADTAWTYTSEYGIELETSNPFKNGAVSSCNYVASKATVVNTGHVEVTPKNMNALLTAIVQQPVAIALAGGVNAFRFYKSGVLTSDCPHQTTHAVLAVGYTTINGHQALIIKNSWGAGWGDNGYLYISTASANNGYGVCGVLSFPAYPV